MTLFFKGSRYADVQDHQIVRSGEVIRYKGMRIIPDTPAYTRHRIQFGERLDHIAHIFYQDPARFWRICDANGAMWPDDLTSDADRTLWIPPSED